jgi:hypothetical protein
MPSKSIHLSEDEAEGLRQLLAETGDTEAAILQRATARGLRDLRLEVGIRAFKAGRSSGEAAKIAGLPRAIFLQELIDRGVTLLDGPSTLGPALAELGRRLGDDRLTNAARFLELNQA